MFPKSAKTATTGWPVDTYTFTTALPEKAAGTFAVGIEGYKNHDDQPDTVN